MSENPRCMVMEQETSQPHCRTVIDVSLSLHAFTCFHRAENTSKIGSCPVSFSNLDCPCTPETRAICEPQASTSIPKSLSIRSVMYAILDYNSKR